MPKAKKDFIRFDQLTREVVNLARGGTPVKRIYERYRRHTTDLDTNKSVTLADVQEIIYEDLMENGF